MQSSTLAVLGRLQRALTTESLCGAITQTRSYAQQSHTHSGKPNSVKEPSYTYLPPGCSMKEPVYISLSDPVHFYDTPAPAAAQQQEVSPQKEEDSAPGHKLPIAAISGATKADNSPHPYKMVDDYSQVTYVTSLKHSMREPKYVSISDPVYAQTDRKPAGKK